MPPPNVGSSDSQSAPSASAEATEAEFPRPFGARYVLLKEIGRGGMGQVYVAATGLAGAERICALKVMRQLDAPGRGPEELGRRFLDEAKVVTKLSHENLVYVFDFGVVDRDLYLAMEYVRGKSLTEVWNRCAVRSVGIPVGVAMYLVTELAAGLAYAHGLEGLNLVHRDISPSNVMLSYTGGVKLIDFGLAKWKSKLSQTVTGVNWGKVSYMSPEQYTGRTIDHRSDLFSLAVLLWELLTGKQLFPNESARNALTELPPPSSLNPHITPALDRVVMRALSFDPEDRYQTADQFMAALAPHLPRDTNKRTLSRFMNDLFEADARAEAADDERLAARAADLRSALEAAASKPATPQPTEARGPDASDPLVGTTLENRYYVRRLVGEGAMGRVYEGHHTGVGKRVAIKVPRSPERRRNEMLQRFRLEATAASQIGHPNIADVLDCGVTPAGDFFFVMEFLDGVDLDRVIKRDGAMTVERALLIGLQVCRALEAAHKVGIIHRDLKPSNVMLMRTRDDTDQVKLLDFGVAKFLRASPSPDGDLTLADAAVGTPRYMAPEQIESGQDIDFRVDIYGVGCVLYGMLTGGRAPVEADSVHELWRKKLNVDPTPLASLRSDLPPPLESLVMRCLARDPEARPASMETLRRGLVTQLERVRAAGSSVLAMRVPSETAKLPPPEPAQPSRRLPIVVAGAAAVLLAGGGLAFWLGSSSRSDREVAVTMVAPTTQATPTPAPAPVALPTPPPVEARTPPAPPPSSKPAPAERPSAVPTPVAKATTAKPPPPTGPNPDQLLDAAQTAFDASELAKAAALASRAAAAGGGARAWSLAGRAHFFLGDYPAALAAYERAAALAPRDPAITRALERVRAQLGTSEAAP